MQRLFFSFLLNLLGYQTVKVLNFAEFGAADFSIFYLITCKIIRILLNNLHKQDFRFVF